MNQNGFVCPRCGLLMDSISKNCPNCNLFFTKAKPINYFTENLHSNSQIYDPEALENLIKYNFRIEFNPKVNTIAVMTDSSGNEFFFRRVPSFVLAFAAIFLVTFFMVVPLMIIPLTYFLIFYVLFLYTGIFILLRFQYFKIYDSNKNIALIRKNKNYFKPKTAIQSDDWALFGLNRKKIFSSHFAFFYTGIIKRKNDSFKIEAITENETNLYYRNIRGYRIYDENDNNLIIISNGKSEIKQSSHFQLVPREFEIYTQPKIDQLFVLYCSFIIIKKYLDIRS